MRYVFFIPMMLVATAAQAGTPLPTQDQYNNMTCTQAVQAAMQIIKRNRPAGVKPLSYDQLATVAREMVDVVETRYRHQPCREREPHAAAPNSAPSVPIRRSAEKGR